MTAPACPIYTVGDGTRTQLAVRADGIWFKRTKLFGSKAALWGPWELCKHRPYDFGIYPVKPAQNARLPDA